jgi:uncharacterized membrane protein HdeD (DUF308 family)
MVRFKKWRWWTVALRGVAAILFGLVSLWAPGVTFVWLVMVFGIYAIVDGALALALAARPIQSRVAMVGRGLVSILAGVLALTLPGITALALLLVIAAWAIVSGIFEIVMAIQLRKQIEGEWLLGVEGVLSIVFGILLMLAPLAGAIVLGIWIGAYALVFGGMQVGTAFRLRSYALQHPELAA